MNVQFLARGNLYRQVGSSYGFTIRNLLADIFMAELENGLLKTVFEFVTYSRSLLRRGYVYNLQRQYPIYYELLNVFNKAHTADKVHF